MWNNIQFGVRGWVQTAVYSQGDLKQVIFPRWVLFSVGKCRGNILLLGGHEIRSIRLLLSNKIFPCVCPSKHKTRENRAGPASGHYSDWNWVSHFGLMSQRVLEVKEQNTGYWSGSKACNILQSNGELCEKSCPSPPLRLIGLLHLRICACPQVSERLVSHAM